MLVYRHIVPTLFFDATALDLIRSTDPARVLRHGGISTYSGLVQKLPFKKRTVRHGKIHNFSMGQSTIIMVNHS